MIVIQWAKITDNRIINVPILGEMHLMWLCAEYFARLFQSFGQILQGYEGNGYELSSTVFLQVKIET